MERDHKELVLEGPGPREQVSGGRRREDPHRSRHTIYQTEAMKSLR